MAPVNQRQQRLVARQGGATAARQQAKAIVQPRHDLVRRKDLDPRRCQLKRQRNPIQAPADLRDGASVLGGQAKWTVRGHRTLHKEARAVVLRQGVEVVWLPWLDWVGQRE